ncbi:MAG TPA: hypothetical protein VGJ94_09040 [Syntrophorhabdaceae bacterium]|jgi:hypothetical protein
MIFLLIMVPIYVGVFYPAIAQNFEGARKERIGQEGVTVFADGSVQVTAKLREEFERPFNIELLVQSAQERFAIETNIIAVANVKEAFEVQERHTYRRDGYLFVRIECGGGNASRCDRNVVFSLRSGRLQRLGEVAAGERDSFKKSGRNGFFYDIYDKFENNRMTDHASAPIFELVLYEQDGRLEADLPRTWLHNQSMFKKKAAKIDAVMADKSLKASIRDPILSALIISNAVIAKYCEKKEEASKLNELAASYLNEEGQELFRQILDEVKPGEYPLPPL